MLEQTETASCQTGWQGILALKSSGDRGEILGPLHKREFRFLIPLRGDRHLVHRGAARPVLDLASTCPLFFRERIIREEAAKEKVFLLDLGYRKAGFPGRFWDLYLQAVKGFRKKLLILLTNLKISESRKDLWRTAESNLVL